MCGISDTLQASAGRGASSLSRHDGGGSVLSKVTIYPLSAFRAYRNTSAASNLLQVQVFIRITFVQVISRVWLIYDFAALCCFRESANRWMGKGGHAPFGVYGKPALSLASRCLSVIPRLKVESVAGSTSGFC